MKWKTNFGRLHASLTHLPSTRHSLSQIRILSMCLPVDIRNGNDSALLAWSPDWRRVPSLLFDIPSKSIPLIRHVSFPSSIVLLFQPLVSSHSLPSPSTFFSIASRKPRVLAKDRDVFSPTATCSCVSCILYHSSNWDPLSSVLRGDALVVW